MSEAKEGKLLGRKKLLDPHLGTTEGTKITSTIIFYTSHALTVYSTGQASLTGVSTVERVATICLFPTARGSGSCTVCSYHSAGYNHEGLAISDRRILVDHFGFPLDLNLIFVWISKKSFP